jgi:hypothetical protein
MGLDPAHAHVSWMVLAGNERESFHGWTRNMGATKPLAKQGEPSEGPAARFATPLVNPG